MAYLFERAPVAAVTTGIAGSAMIAVKVGSAGAVMVVNSMPDKLDPMTAEMLISMNDQSFVVSGFLICLAFLAAGVGLLATEFPRWLSWWATVAGGLGVVAGMVGIVRPEAYLPIPFLLLLVWMIAVAIATVTRPDNAARVPEKRLTTRSLPQNEPMSTTRGATVAAWWPWLALPAVATGLVSAGLALGLTDPEGNWIKGEAWVNVPLAIGFSTVAAGIWSTRPHPVGVRRLAVLYTVVGLGAALVLPAHGWARSDVAGAGFAAWVSNWVWSLGAAPLLGIGLLLYPDGRLPGRRWWPAAAIGLDRNGGDSPRLRH